MNIPNTNPKLKAAISLAKVRGYKSLREEQMTALRELIALEELSVTECVDAVLNAPKERMHRTFKSTRKHTSKLLSRLATIIEEK